MIPICVREIATNKRLARRKMKLDEVKHYPWWPHDSSSGQDHGSTKRSGLVSPLWAFFPTSFLGRNSTNHLQGLCDGTLLWSGQCCVWVRISSLKYAVRVLTRWCIYLRYKSSGTYKESSVVSLPSQRTLRDYTHYIPPTIGFSSEVDQELIAADRLDEWQKYVIVILDEMHIKEDLVHEKHSGEFIGFANLGTSYLNLSKLWIKALHWHLLQSPCL